jgi:glycosyltransferase involved in cell wall biosynthesis
MKVLWLTNGLMPDHAVALGMAQPHGGGWLAALAQGLVADGRIELGVVTSLPGVQEGSVTVNGVLYYTVPQSTGKINYRVLPRELIEGYQQVSKSFRPQVLHIHGTEYFHGLLTGRGYLSGAAVISIQGIIDVSARHYQAGVPLLTLLFKRTLRDWVRMDGLLEQQIRWRRRAQWEQKLFATNTAFIGRTLWDRAHLRRLNPSARYFHCDELIREPFYRAKWDMEETNHHQIFCSSASYPLKGFHVLLKAVALLKNEFPDINVLTPLAQFHASSRGWTQLYKKCRMDGYARYLTDFIQKNELERHIVALQTLSAEEMVVEFLNARVFVLPSYIENSPNSLAEAMLVGTPSVVADVGGISSMVKDGSTSLLFPSGDEAVLAEQIRRVFRDDDLAQRLSIRARAVSRTRHSKDKIVNKMIEIYGHVKQ